MRKAVIWVDGVARGNPGPAAIAGILKDEEGKVHSRFSKCIGIATNNQAEYQAVIAGMERAISLGANAVGINSDSELIVRQLNGRYRVKHAMLKPLYERVKQLRSSLISFTVKHIPREQNWEADSLVNKALDNALTN